MADTYTHLLYHLLFSNKDRAPLITADLQPDLYAYLGGIARTVGGHLVAAGGMPDHVHLRCHIAPTVAVADMLQRLKGGASAWVNQERSADSHFSWQAGNGAFTVSRSTKEDVLASIANQAEHHRVTTFQEEYVKFLEKHKID